MAIAARAFRDSLRITMSLQRALCLLGVLAMTSELLANTSAASETVRPIVIGHRGASGYVPEHTLTSYFIAVQQGADFIEPDLVSTKDGVLVARHENEIGGTTDVGMHPEFAARKTTKKIDGKSVEGWFTEDFTLAELKTLRAKERLPQLRTGNARFDGQFEIPTFDEILSMVRALERMHGPTVPRIGVYPETKHPSYFRSIDLPLEGPLLRTLKRWGYRGKDAPIFIQSFEVGNLQALRKKTQIQLVQLMEASGAPYDFTARGDSRTYADLATADGLREVALYADAIGVEKSMVIPRDTDNALLPPTALVNHAHAAGLKVHVWTMRAENNFLPKFFASNDNPAALGNLAGEIAAFLTTNIDGFFSDHPDIGVKARDAYQSGK
jgi:glycerophosphoryl diester phosphodiesterase